MQQPDFSPSTLRRHVLDMAFTGNSVHVGCAFSLMEIVSVLYGKLLRYSPHSPACEGNDRVVLSKGHGVMALYACFKELGWLPQECFDRYFSDGSSLHGLGECHTPGLEVTAGSLGHGLPVAVGMALGLRRLGSDRRVYCIVGDGEINEGTIWEALLFAGHHQLNNLVVVVDANGFQAMGRVADIMNLEPLAAKLSSFGMSVAECDGHDLAQLESALQPATTRQPKAVIARTIKGKGVSFMENNNMWHYLRMTPDTYANASAEIGGRNHA